MGSSTGTDLDHDHDLGGLTGLPGMEPVTDQLALWIAVVRAERSRRQAGVEILRPGWKNLVFTGGPGSGKTRAAKAIARIYHELGLLSYGNLREVPAADLAGTTPRETGELIGETVRRAVGELVMIPDAHAWSGLHDRGQHVLRCLYQELTYSRDHLGGQLAVILAGQAAPLRGMLAASPALAARFPAVIDFPGYTAAQLAGIFATLAGEAGFTLTPAAVRKAAGVLAQADRGHGSGNARLAVRLLDQVTASQARRITAASHSPDPTTLSTIRATDIPEHVQPSDTPGGDQWPGQYL